MPIFAGLVLAKILGLLSVPLAVIGFLFPGDDPMIALEREVNHYASIMSIFAVISFVAAFAQKYCFATLGENVTIGVRKLLYNNILQKNIGWFDLRENSTGVLSSAMA